MFITSAAILAAFVTNAACVQQSSNNGQALDFSQFRMEITGKYTSSNKVVQQEPSQSLKPEDYVQAANNFVKKTLPGATYRLINDHYIGTDGVGHVYFKQTANGLDIDNANFNVNVAKNGSVLSYGNSFYSGSIPSPKPLQKRDPNGPVNALTGVTGALRLKISPADATIETQAPNKYLIKGAKGVYQDPIVQLVYLQSPKNDLVLSWKVETDLYQNWMLSYTDAANTNNILGVVDYFSGATYQVYPWGLIDPSEGERESLVDPWDSAASPFTWQGDGTTTYNTTRGNNAIAHTNWNPSDDFLNKYRPESEDQTFVYPFDLTTNDFKSYANASITQLFYTANMYHDLLYSLGFNEKAGNFQTNNADKGGKGNDFVVLNAQDGGGMDNARFSTPADGRNPRMFMFMWDTTSPVRDGSFVSDIVIHEYTHGLSNRLTGGPDTTGCLGTTEAGGMGEGWSDFMAVSTQINTTDTRDTNYVMGAWVEGPAGIRKYPYSTNMTTNPHVYADINSLNRVHDIGEVWATILYEVLWNLIDIHGVTSAIRPSFDYNHVPTEGRYLAMQLVINGMALQPCNPTFISARDAIIDADAALTGSANSCAIWKAFAKRGLGFSAKGSSRPVEQGFDLPPTCT